MRVQPKRRASGRHHHAHGGHGHWDDERPRGRSLEYGQLRFLLLQLLAERPGHGYQLMKAIEELTAGSYAPSPGVVYPTLALLEDLGYIGVAASGESRKLYRITAAGRRYLGENKAAVQQVTARLSDAAATRGAFEAPQIVRAMHNLKMALRLKLDAGGLGAERIQALAAALDAAAAAIERV